MRATIALLIAFAGCGNRGTTVLVEVGAASPIDGIARLSLGATVAGMNRQYDVTPPNPSIPPAVSIAIDVAPSISGTLHVEIAALTRRARSSDRPWATPR